MDEMIKMLANAPEEPRRAFEEAAREQMERSKRGAKDLSVQADVMFG